MTLTADLIERVWEIEYASFDSDDLYAFRSLLLDHIGVAVNGSAVESAVAFRRFVDQVTGGGEHPAIGTRETSDPIRAAMSNAVAAHSIEYDDVHNASSSHPGVVIFPTAIAAAQLTGADAEAFVLAVFRGYEVMCRVGRAANPQAHYARHFHPTGTIGHFGAAAAAASLLGLGEEETRSALGIAATMASGSMQFLLDGAWTKRFHPAHAARNGLEAALMAEAGYRGTLDGIGGDRAFLAGYSANPEPKEILRDWGYRPYEVRNTSIKAHTCCRYKQGPIDALIQIRQEHRIHSEAVKAIRVGIPSVAEDIISVPLDLKRRPTTIVDAQFSMPYGAAVAMTAGAASLEEYDGTLFEDEEIRRLMDVTESVVDTDLDLSYPAQWRAWAEVVTTSGEVYRADIDDPKGDPTNPLTAEEISTKFRRLTREAYSGQRQKTVEDVVSTLGHGSSFQDLVGLLPSDAT